MAVKIRLKRMGKIRAPYYRVVVVDSRKKRDGRVIEEDPHGGWERLLPIWEKKEPAIVFFLKQRVALPLFFERSLIEITPRRVLYWSDGRAQRAPSVTDLGEEAA